MLSFSAVIVYIETFYIVSREFVAHVSLVYNMLSLLAVFDKV